MSIIYVIDTYAGDGSEANPYRPAILDAMPDATMTDVSGIDAANIIPSVNMLVVQIMADVAAIETHPDYGVGAILYDLPNPYPPNGAPDAAEYGQRRAYMARLKIPQSQIKQLLGNPGNPRTRKDVADLTINYARTLQKGNN